MELIPLISPLEPIDHLPLKVFGVDKINLKIEAQVSSIANYQEY